MVLSRRKGFWRIALAWAICAWLSANVSAASLSGTFTPVSGGTSVDLSVAGNDWVLWGLEEANRKAAVPPLIGDLVLLGPNDPTAVSNFPVLFNWSDGTPVSQGTNVASALSMQGLTNGFALNVPAGILKRKLRVYAGCQAAQGVLRADLSDGSAAAFADMSLNASNGIGAGVYDLDYSAASDGQTLTISWTMGQSFDEAMANVQIAAAILSTNIPPIVTLTTPTNNSTFTAPANVSITIDAQDADGAIAKVELYSGLTKVADLTNAPYSFLMTNVSVGNYVLSARAFDNNGDQATSPSVSFSVVSNVAPQITLLTPTNDQNFSISDSIYLSAIAQDPDGQIARVEWYVGNTKVGESLTEPYSLVVTNLPAAFHTIKAVAVDQFQAQKSASAIIAVNSGLGSLSMLYAIAPTRVNLSAEGLTDWAHWGLYTESTFNHKAGVTPQIGTYSIIGNDMPYPYADNFTLYTWTDGTPIASAVDTPTGVYIVGLNNGFEVRAPADTTLKTLKLYVGTFGARGKLRTYLSDFSAPLLVDDSLDNPSNGPDAVYTLRYQAGAPGKSIVARYTVSAMHDGYGNVTLQAATLVSDNNPPFASITNPPNNSAFLAGTNILIEADARDDDGSVARVEFYQGVTKLGEASTAPYAVTWTNVPAGNYSITARAIDNKGATFISTPAEISVITGGGVLLASLSPGPPQANLTFEGRADWAHWGYRTKSSFDHKRLVAQPLPTFVPLGDAQTSQYSDNFTAFTWSDGTPTLSVSSTRTGVYRPGLNNGFEIVVPADQTLRRLKIYAGLYAAHGRFEASLSDFSAARYVDRSLINIGSSSVGVYTLYFAASSPTQKLTLRYQSDVIFDQAYGNVTLQAATLAVVPPPPVLQISRVPNPLSLSLNLTTEPSFGYAIESAADLSVPTWTPFTNFVAGGVETAITNITPSAPASFYRARFQR